MTHKTVLFPLPLERVQTPAARAQTMRTPSTPHNRPQLQAHQGLRGTDAARARMVGRLENIHGINDERVLRALFAIERHRFVDTGLIAQAYEDTSLPIGFEQTISKPQIVARMLQHLLQIDYPQGARVLEIGTGCAYQAAVLSHLFSRVYSIERIQGLHERARALMDALRPSPAYTRLNSVQLILGDGMLGDNRGAPYHAIISAAGGRELPAAWLKQLAPGGRLIAPTVQDSGQQALVVVDKDAHGNIEQHTLDAVHFVPLKSGLS